MSALLEAARKIRAWRANAKLFFVDNFKVELEWWEEEFCDALSDPSCQQIALKSSKGPGKTAKLAMAGWYSLSCFAERGEHPKGAAISISGENLKDCLWPELAKWRARSPFLLEAFEWTKERIFARDHPETWFLSARQWSKSADKTQQANALAGLRAKNVFWLVDESGGIPKAVMSAVGPALSTASWGKVIQAGNPTHRSGPLYDACTTERPFWKVIEVTGDPDHPKRSKRVSIEWAREEIKKAPMGRDDPWVKVNVLGEFPDADINALLGPDDVSASQGRTPKLEDYDFIQKRIGVDVAREGDDRTVLFPRQGILANSPVVLRGAKSPEVAARVAVAKEKWGSEVELVDNTGGFGGGVIDALEQAGIFPIPVNFSGRADDPMFANKRAEMWWRMAEWVKGGGCLPPDQDLHAELTAPTYTFVRGRLQIEDKDRIKERLGFSPDKADALVLTFALVDLPANPAIAALHAMKKRGYRSEGLRAAFDRAGRSDLAWNPLSKDRLK